MGFKVYQNEMKLTRYNFELDQLQKVIVPGMDNIKRVPYKKAVDMPKTRLRYMELFPRTQTICNSDMSRLAHYV